MAMAISEKDIKLLWGRAAGRCSFPGCNQKLTQDKAFVTDSFPLGEQAHIVGKSNKSLRGSSNLTEDERDSYFNIILLCPTHHTIIDNDEIEYTIEKLHFFKDQHEYNVEHIFSETKDTKDTVNDIIYADLVDSTVEACQLDNWHRWASNAASLYMVWNEDAPNRIYSFYNKILGAIWPRTFPELECSIKKLTYELHNGVELFMKHCEKIENQYTEIKFYKISEWNPELYHELLKEYEEWHDKCEKHIDEATKAANWFAEIVRRDINPLFFTTKGKFFLEKGPYEMLQFRTYFLEYTEEEKEEICRTYDLTWSLWSNFKPLNQSNDNQL